MGARKLRENLALLEQQGYPRETPAAYVASATTPKQEVVVGTIANLVDRVAHVDVALPALVIVGDVVNVRDAWRGVRVGTEDVGGDA
jgi:siroheme synthase